MKYGCTLFLILFTSANAFGQLVPKTLNVQGVLKSTGGTLLSGSYGMRFTFKKNGAAFATPCQISKNSVAVTNGVFNAAVDVSACNLAAEIPAVTAPAITVDIEVDLLSATFTTAMVSFTGLTMTPTAMSLVAERAGSLTLAGTSGQVLTHNGTSWVAGSVNGANIAAASLNLGTSTAITGVLPVANGGTGSSSLAGVKAAIGAASSGANSDITSLTGLTTALSMGQGGTGATTAAAARTNLGAASSGANSDITSLSGLLSAVSVNQGGTGAVNAISARSNLGAAASGANSDITSLGGLTTALSIAQGGTGSTTAAGARTALGLGDVSLITKSGLATDYLKGDGTWGPAAAAAVSSVAGRTGAVTLSTTDVSGLGTAATLASTAVLQSANNLSDVGNSATARTNLGLGTAATMASTAFMQSANNLSDVANAGTARTNLGLGTAATLASTAVLQSANNLSDLGSASTARTNLGLGNVATLSTNSSTTQFLRGDGTWANQAVTSVAGKTAAVSLVVGDVSGAAASGANSDITSMAAVTSVGSSGSLSLASASGSTTTVGNSGGASATTIQAGSGGIKIGASGSALSSGILVGTLTGLSDTVSVNRTVTVTGAVVGDAVFCAYSIGSGTAQTSANYWRAAAPVVTAADTVTVTLVASGTPKAITALKCYIIK